MDAEKVFLDNVALIERITAFVCRRSRMTPADADDFRGHVHLRLCEDDYAVLRKFEGRSSLSTYLTTVIRRLLGEHRVQMWGKWRPSAEAKRLGEDAILVERMLTRDGCTFDDVVAELTTGESPLFTRPELEAIVVRLPQRQPRPTLVSEEASAGVAAASSADTDTLRHDRQERARGVAAALDCAINRFDAEDRLILQMRFWHALKVPEIAAILHDDQKRLYKRIDRLVARLRSALADGGISRDEIGDLLEHTDHGLTVKSMEGWEKSLTRPSDHADGETTSHRGRLSS